MILLLSQPRLSDSVRLEYRFRESCHKQGIHLSFQAPMCAGGIEDEGLKAMAAWRRAIELSLGDADVQFPRQPAPVLCDGDRRYAAVDQSDEGDQAAPRHGAMGLVPAQS